MGQSAAFARIRQQVLQLTACVPFGRVTTFAAIGVHLEVLPRHVAYILATLPPAERELLPWYRVLPEQGILASGKDEQHALLIAEGHTFDAQRKITHFERKFFAVDETTTGLPHQPRPAQTLTKKRC